MTNRHLVDPSSNPSGFESGIWGTEETFLMGTSACSSPARLK